MRLFPRSALARACSYAFTYAFPIFALTACGGGSDVGSQNDAPPVASAEVLGSAQTTSGEVQVRSGKEVLLSGFNSEGVDDPILTFSWRQVEGSDYPVELYERTADAVAFTAPDIPITDTDGVSLMFELTAVDADGVSATDTVSVRVKPARDADHFLINPRVEEDYVVIVAPNPGTLVSADIPVSLTVTQTATWRDRSGAEHSQVIATDTVSGEIAAGLSPATQSAENLFFRLPVPLLDADDVNKNFQGENRLSRLEFENVDEASLTISLSLAQEASGNFNLYLATQAESGFDMLDTSALVAGENSLTFDTEWLRINLGVESRRSAENYYRCIDPNDEATTLAGWIDYAGFNDYPESVVHTSYVNNYDLNFGRDMYLRKDENGNVYSYVTNYPSLENIFSGRNEFAIVVMEYSSAPTGQCGDGTFADDDGGKKIVKFYSYVPNEITGEYERAGTMNFDGRGERSVPGVCVGCHFGDTNSDQFNLANLSDISAEAADLNSSFIPWDLDAFLYTSSAEDDVVDPIYTSNETSPEVTAQYSREAQQDYFRQQNQMVLDTFTYDLGALKRFETPIKLLHGWYGNAEAVESLDFGSEEAPLTEEALAAVKAQVLTLPTNDFDGTYVQSGWEGQEELYHNVFARNCRLCHAQVAEATIDFDSYDEFINNGQLVSYVFEQGLMPLSRLTMDRFWVNFYNDSQPAAELLREHLNNDNIVDNDVAPGLRPGYPVARALPTANPELDADASVDFDGRILFDASASLFATNYEWSINGEFVGDESKYVYSAGEPGDRVQLTLAALNVDENLVSQRVSRRILVNNNTPSAEGVPSPNVNEGEAVTVNIFTSLCANGLPDDSACRAVFGDVEQGDRPLITLSEDSVNGDVALLDSSNGLVRFTSTAPVSDGDGEFTFSLTDSFGEVSELARVSVVINALGGPEINGPDTCTVDALNQDTSAEFPQFFDGVPCADPSLNDVAADGLSLQVVAVDDGSARAGTSVSVDNSGVISYTPGRFFTGTDTFGYTVRDSSLSQNENSGTVVVTVNATETYTSLSTGDGVFARSDGTGCGECHDGTLSGAPSWFLVDNAQLAAVNNNLAPYGVAEITLAEPTSTTDLLDAIILKNGCNFDGGHPGGNILCNAPGTPTGVGDLNEAGLAILKWMEEGAQDN